MRNPSRQNRAFSKIAFAIVIIAIILLSFATGSTFLVHDGNITTRSISSSSSISVAEHTDVTSASLSTSLTTTTSLIITTSVSSTFEVVPTTTSSSSGNANSSCKTGGSFPGDVWNSTLHGVDYIWAPVFAGNDGGPPSEALPGIKSFGFNLLRVPLSWYQLEENETGYLADLTQIAIEAQSEGLYVVYTALTSGSGNEPGEFFPASLAATYGSGSAFLTSWWEGNVNYQGMPGWTALWDDFWVPVIQTVNCYSNTLGYELENEPHVDGASQGDFQNFNQVFAQQMRAMTNKYIIFMASGQGMNPALDAIGQPTNVTNIVLDAHCYNYQASCGDPPDEFSALENYSKSTEIPVWIGEWGIDTPTANDSLPQIQQYGSLFKEYDYANSYWAWSCTPTVEDIALLTGINCQPFWLTTLVSQAQGE